LTRPEAASLESNDDAAEVASASIFDVISLFEKWAPSSPRGTTPAAYDLFAQSGEGAKAPIDKPLDAASKAPAAEQPNRWYANGEKREGVNSLRLTSEYRVSNADFARANPDFARQKLDDLDTTRSYKLWHPTTGQIDDGWKVKGENPDGTMTFSREYTQDVRARKDHSRGVLEAMPDIPYAFIKHVQSKLDQLPANVLQSLERKGYKILAAETIPAAIPELAQLTPRGWSRSTNFFNSDGTHDDVSKRIIAPMKVLQDGQFEDVSRDNVVVHQIGHALDFAHGFLSNSPEFIRAYDADMNNIQEKDNHIYKYFSQKDGPGRQETFASIFGVAFGMPENESDRKFLTEKFPNVMEVVRKQIKELK
jgi:hypothetical protein